VFEVSCDQSRERALVRLRRLKQPLPAGFTFGRADANARSGVFRHERADLCHRTERSARGACRGIAGGRWGGQGAGAERIRFVARRKLGMGWDDVKDALAAVRILCPNPASLTVATHDAALKIAEMYGCGIYDALIAAAALEAKCTTLYSEDLQDGQLFEGRLTVRNPFV
jgi:hypothetical protein